MVDELELTVLAVLPPESPMSLGKNRPVGAPVAGLKLRLPPHWIPRAREKLFDASTIRASMCTCGVRVSSALTSCRTWLRFRSMSRTIRLLVRSS
jgi:hypothetical protein